MKFLISFLFGLSLIFASLQSKGAIVESFRFQISLEQKLSNSNVPVFASDNPNMDLHLIFQQRKPGVLCRFTTVDGNPAGARYMSQSPDLRGDQNQLSSSFYFRSIGLLLIFPKHYFL